MEKDLTMLVIGDCGIGKSTFMREVKNRLKDLYKMDIIFRFDEVEIMTIQKLKKVEKA